MLGERVRRPGAGPKRRIDVGPELLVLLDSLVEPESRGHPMSPLRWTLKSTRVLAAELGRLGHRPERTRWGICCTTSGTASRPTPKVAEGKQHPDRDGQFRYINETAGEHLAAGQPVISVDCKKKELVGDYANGGKEWEPQGEPTRVGVHGWERMGKARYPDATHLMITADAAILDAVGVDVWLPALGRDREPRDDGAVVAELTSLIDDPKLPAGTRLIVRREPLHPGAQRSLFPSMDYRYWGFYTDQPGDPRDLDATMRAHAHVEQHIARLKDSGLCRFPFNRFESNEAWLMTVTLAADLLRWFAIMCLPASWVNTRPKRLRWTLLHAPGRLVRTARQTVVRIIDDWPTADVLTHAYQRIAHIT